MLRGAIVGFGNVAEFGHCPAYAGNDEVEIVAIVDPSPARRAAAARLAPSLGAFASLTEMRNQALDFVDICTPPALHAEPMLEAISRGWNVLCEKPLLLDPSLVNKVREQALKKNLAVIPVHNWKYAPIIRAATKLLRDGKIGELREVVITTWRMRAAATADTAAGNWRLDPAFAGGGILMDHGWHATYLALDWFGERPLPVEVKLHWSPGLHLEDEALVKLQFPSGTAQLELSWNASRRRNSIHLRGTQGQIVIDDGQLQLASRRTQFDSALSTGSHHADWFSAMLPNVINLIRKPELSLGCFEEAAICLTTIHACYKLASTPQASARR